jgi:hypothetical protein
MMDEVPGEWRKLHIEELNDLYFSQTVVWVILRSEMCGACGSYGGQENCMQCFCGGSLKERDRLGDLGVDGRCGS